MLVVFLDGTNTPERTGWFVLGGVVIADEGLLPLEEAFTATLKKAGVPVEQEGLDLEVKWSPRRGNWIRENLSGDDREELYCDLLKTAFGLGCRIVAAVLNWGGMTDRRTRRKYSGDEARDVAYELVLERVQAHAHQVAETALVICDCEEEPETTRERVRRTIQLV